MRLTSDEKRKINELQALMGHIGFIADKPDKYLLSQQHLRLRELLSAVCRANRCPEQDREELEKEARRLASIIVHYLEACMKAAGNPKLFTALRYAKKKPAEYAKELLGKDERPAEKARNDLDHCITMSAKCLGEYEQQK